MYLSRTGRSQNEGYKMSHIKKINLILSLLILNTATYAEDQLPPIVVSATRSVQSTVTTPSSITILTAEDIEQSGAQHIVELLNTQASIQLSDLYGNGSRATISMRGFADNAKSNTLIMVDGRRLNNADLAAPDLSGISLKDVKQIEIIQGSAGTLYGDQAVGGVINIITKTPEKYSASAELEFGSYNTQNIRSSISNKINDLSYRFSVEKLDSNNYREHNKQDYLNILGRVDYKIGDSNVFFDIQSINEKLELPGSLTKAEMQADPKQVSTTNPDDFNDGNTNIKRIGLNSSIANNWNLEAEFTQKDSDITGKSSSADFTQKREHQSLSPRLVGTIPGNSGETLLTIGIDYNTYDYKYKVPTWFIDTTAMQQTDALYLQSVIPVSEKTTLTLGGRHARVNYNITDATAFPTGTSLKNDATVFELGISTFLSNSTRVFFRVDENFRFAKIDENTYTSASVTGLDTQTGQSFELGSEWKNISSSAKVVVYLLNLKNEIDYDSTAPGPGMFAGANANLDPTKRTGIILEGGHHFTPSFSVKAQYNYIDGTFDGGSFSGNAIPFVAKQNLSASASYKISSTWTTSTDIRYISSRFQAADYSNTLDKLSEVTTINAQLRYQLRNWSAALRINNITNEKYVSYAVFNGYYTAPERNVMANVRYTF